MIGKMKEEMRSKGVKNKKKGWCNEWEKKIVGKVIKEIGKKWKNENFNWKNWKKEMGKSKLFESDGNNYCENE